MDAGRFLEFIYFSLFIISVNFPDQLVTDMSKPVLRSRTHWKWVFDDSHFAAKGGRKL